jgi:hypothetical protein
MIKIEYPPYQPKIKNENNTEFIFDTFRKRWVVLTPEEWVRQNFLNYLIQTKKYPSTLIAVEKEITINNLKKRFDIVVYDLHTQPWMLIECKEMQVALTEKVLNQTLMYQSFLQSKYVVVTNGVNCIAFECINNQFNAINELPNF